MKNPLENLHQTLGIGAVVALIILFLGKPTFDLTFYAVNKRGEFGAASLHPGRYAAHDGVEAKLRDVAHLYERPAASR